MHAAVLMPCDQHLVLAEMGAHEITRLWYLAFMGDVDPEPPEDALLLQREHVRIGVGPAMDVVAAHKTQYVISAQALRSGSRHRKLPGKRGEDRDALLTYSLIFCLSALYSCIESPNQHPSAYRRR